MLTRKRGGRFFCLAVLPGCLLMCGVATEQSARQVDGTPLTGPITG